MGPLDFFKTMHEAFARILAAGQKPATLIDLVANQAFEFFESNIVTQSQGLPELGCRKNCPSCCTLRVTATAPEIFRDIPFKSIGFPTLKARWRKSNPETTTRISSTTGWVRGPGSSSSSK